MEVSDGKFNAITLDEENNVLLLEWKPASEDLTDELFREEFEKWMDSGKKYKPKAMIVDSVNFLYGAAPETQAWAAQYHIKLGVPKVAFVLSEDVFAQVSIEMAVEQFKGIDAKYFSDIDEAKKWANS